MELVGLSAFVCWLAFDTSFKTKGSLSSKAVACVRWWSSVVPEAVACLVITTAVYRCTIFCKLHLEFTVNVLVMQLKKGKLGTIK